MDTPLTADEIALAAERLRVERPLHWNLARRLLAEVVRLRAVLDPPRTDPAETRPPAPAPAPRDDEGPVTSP